jgi:hypothetical protein
MLHIANHKVRKAVNLRLFTIVLALLFVTVNNSIFAQAIGGGYTDSYMLRDVGARAIGLGGAYTAISNDPSTLYYNPAGLTDLTDAPEINSMFSILGNMRTHSVLCWGQTVTDNIGVGFGINSFTSGSFISRDIRGTHIKNISAFDYSVTAGAAYSMEFASMGVAVKYISNTLQGTGANSNGIAIDFGSKFNIKNLFTFGLAIQNVGGYSHWNTSGGESNYLPFTIRSGVAMEFALNENEYKTRSTVTGEEETLTLPATRYIVLDLDAKFTQYENTPTLSIGVEVIPHEIIGFRGGIALWGNDYGQNKLLPMTVWGAGVSLRPEIPELPFFTHIDYSVAADYLSQSKVAHHLSIYLEF